MPRPATGKTPVRNLRVADDIWLPALARAVSENRDLTEVLTDCLRRYNAKQPHQFTFAQWPDARRWLEAEFPGWETAAGKIADLGIADVDQEYAGVAMWLAITRHPGNRTQQQRVIAGFLLGRANTVRQGGWRDRYMNSSVLLWAITAVLEGGLPRRPPDA